MHNHISSQTHADNTRRQHTHIVNMSHTNTPSSVSNCTTTMLFQLSLLVSTAFLFYLSFRTFFCPSLPKPSLTIFKSAIVDTLHSCIAPLILLFPYYFQRYPPSIPYPTHPTGLILGLISVAIAQVVIVLYQVREQEWEEKSRSRWRRTARERRAARKRRTARERRTARRQEREAEIRRSRTELL